MEYALIKNGVVTNVISLHPMNEADFPNAVRLDDIPVAKGDTYTDGAFYRNGEQILGESARISDMEGALAILFGGEGV